jgi:hypothetical protein
MRNVASQKAADLPQGVKSAVEQLLGRLIDADEEVSVVAVPPQPIPPVGNRAAIAQRLEEFLNRRARKTADVPEEELDGPINDAVDHVRHRRR